jgi:hypothetical protein
VKAIGKVFKKVGEAIKKVISSPVFKVILVAAAVYFTGGMALAAFPEVGAAIGGIGATAAETVTGVAGAMGFGEAGAGAFAGATAAGEAGALGGAAATDAAITGAELGSASEGASLYGASGAAEAGAANVAGDIAGATTAANGAEAANAATVAVDDYGNPLTLGAGPNGATPATAATQAANGAATTPSAITGTPAPVVNASAPVPGTGAVARTMGQQFLDRIGNYLGTNAGLNLAGNAIMGLGKGAMDARAQEAQREWLESQRRWGSAVPDVTGYYRPQPQGGLVARYMSQNSPTKPGG